jgi:hypothetical protein
MTQPTEPVTIRAELLSIAAEMAAYDANPDAYRDELLAMLAPAPLDRRLNRQAFKRRQSR